MSSPAARPLRGSRTYSRGVSRCSTATLLASRGTGSLDTGRSARPTSRLGRKPRKGVRGSYPCFVEFLSFFALHEKEPESLAPILMRYLDASIVLCCILGMGFSVRPGLPAIQSRLLSTWAGQRVISGVRLGSRGWGEKEKERKKTDPRMSDESDSNHLGWTRYNFFSDISLVLNLGPQRLLRPGS